MNKMSRSTSWSVIFLASKSKDLMKKIKMATENIIEINVGGRLFQTTVFTLTKYPGSMLSAMFSHTDIGMPPMPRTKDGKLYFLDVDPKYFEIILNWLRMGEIKSNTPDIMKGTLTLSLANYFGLEDL